MSETGLHWPSCSLVTRPSDRQLLSRRTEPPPCTGDSVLSCCPAPEAPYPNPGAPRCPRAQQPLGGVTTHSPGSSWPLDGRGWAGPGDPRLHSDRGDQPEDAGFSERQEDSTSPRKPLGTILGEGVLCPAQPGSPAVAQWPVQGKRRGGYRSPRPPGEAHRRQLQPMALPGRSSACPKAPHPLPRPSPTHGHPGAGPAGPRLLSAPSGASGGRQQPGPSALRPGLLPSPPGLAHPAQLGGGLGLRSSRE